MARNKIEINLKNNLNQILSERKIQKIEQVFHKSYPQVDNVIHGRWKRKKIVF